MRNITVAVGISKYLVVLKGLPDIEGNAGLHDLLYDEVEDGDYDLEPGIYTADVQVGYYTGGNPWDDDIKLELDNFVKIKEYIHETK
jgi:hypothetical protein